MTKKKSFRKPAANTRIIDPVRHTWMRVVRSVTLVMLSIVTLISLAAAILKYYNHITKISFNAK